MTTQKAFSKTQAVC